VTFIPPYSPSLPDWQRQVSAAFNNLGSTGALTATFSGIPFTNTAHYSSAQWLTNGATPGAWYNSAFAGNNVTEGLTAAIIVPATATNYQTNAGAFYIRADRSQMSNGGEVALFSYAISNANNAAVFPFNSVGADSAGFTGQTIGSELDWNVSAADTDVNGSNQVIVSTSGAALTGDRIAYAARGAFHANSQWSHAYLTEDGRVELYGVFLGSQTATAGTNRNSQKIALRSYNSANSSFDATMRGDSGGGLQIAPGAATGAVAVVDPTYATIWAYIDDNGFTLPEIAAASVASPAAGYQTLFIDTADNKLKRKNSAGTVTIIA
jgi:hypothetical protein